MPFPISRYTSRGPWHRLVQRVVLRRRERRTFECLLADVVPEPVLAWLEAPDDVVSSAPGMTGSVLARRRVAAADVAAPGASAQVEPPSVRREALDATSAARRHPGVDAVISHVLSLRFSRDELAGLAGQRRPVFTRGLIVIKCQVECGSPLAACSARSKPSSRASDAPKQ